MEVTRVPVSLGERSYDVVIGERLLTELRAFAEAARPTSIFLVTDSNVGPHHAEAVQNAVVANHVLTVPAGENSKSLAQLEALYDQVFATRQLDRHSLIIALGGGVVGDLAGYLAATLLRGLRYVQVPTSLLAMVDSSVGGKTAINHASGKNLIGAFHQPAAVFCDLHFLQTLPEREYLSALAEVVKTAAISGEELLAAVEHGVAALLAREPEKLQRLVEACIRFKAEVVMDDERETAGLRATLNFGHTLAHAIEAHLGYGKLTHGEAVVLGMAYALELSESPELPRFLNWAKVNRYPLELLVNMPFDELLPYMKKDKKSTAAALNFVLLGAIGRPYIETVPEQRAQAAYDKLRKTIKEMI